MVLNVVSFNDFCSFAEVVSLSAVLPFIAVITKPDKFFNFP